MTHVKQLSSLPELKQGDLRMFDDQVYVVKEIIQSFDEYSQSITFDIILELITPKSDINVN